MDNDYVVIVDGELYHYGTKGMKWGRRLFQNKDGSLTALGKKRYLNSDGTLNKAGKKMRKEEADALKAREAAVKKRESEARQKVRQDAKKAELDAREKALDGGKVPKSTKAAQKAAAAETKSMKDMSDAEIRAAISRKQLEDQYRQAFPEQIPKGKQFAQKMLDEAIIPAAVKGGKDFLEKSMAKITERALKGKVDPDSIEALTKVKEKLGLKKDIETLKNEIITQKTGKPEHLLTADERQKLATAQKTLQDVEDAKAAAARADAEYKAESKKRSLIREKETEGIRKDIATNKRNRAEQEELLRTKKNEIANTIKAEKDAKASKKQAEKDARDAEKQAKKDAKTAEKEAKREAKAEAKKAAEMEKYNEYQEAYKKSLDIDTPNTMYSSKGGERTRTGKAIIAGLLGAPSSDDSSTAKSNSNVGETSTALISKIRTMTNSGNKTYSEIANQLGVSVSTVQNYSNGKKAADRFMTYDEKGNFVGYWSAIKVDDANVI